MAKTAVPVSRPLRADKYGGAVDKSIPAHVPHIFFLCSGASKFFQNFRVRRNIQQKHSVEIFAPVDNESMPLGISFSSEHRPLL
jgi:hypothetical protein